MRVFLCAYGDFFIAIPMAFVSSLSLHIGKAVSSTAVAYYNRTNNNTYVSLPLLFNFPQEIIRHRITLKNQADENDDSVEDRTILLSTEILCETDIPDGDIYPVPDVLTKTQFFELFRGITFTDRPVLLLNPVQLIHHMRKVAV
jgi:hypothetical protein